MVRRLLVLIMLLSMLCGLGMAAYAHEIPDLTQTGAIHVTISHNGVEVPGGSLTLYRVGAICEDDGNYGFVLTEEYLESKLPLDDLQDSALAQGLAEYVSDHAIIGMTRPIDDQGCVSFDELELGLYLLVQNEAAPGYSRLNPFLVTVPAHRDGRYVYEVDASPKVGTLTTEPTEPTMPTEPDAPSLPQTGQLNWPVPVLVVSGLSLFSIGWMLCFRRKKEEYES